MTAGSAESRQAGRREPFKFHAPIQVRFNETDAQGHVNFGHYLFYFDFALTEYLKAIGYSYRRMTDEGADMLYVASRASYQSPAYFEEVLNVHVRMGRIGNSSVRFDFQVLAQPDARPVAEGEITVVMVERESHRKVPVPPGLAQAQREFEGLGGESQDLS